MFRGMAPAAALEEAAQRAAEDFLAVGTPWTSCQLTFEKPAFFAIGDELWLHLDVLAPGRHVSITRTRPLGTDMSQEPTEEFVRQTFLGARRALGTQPRATLHEHCEEAAFGQLAA